MRLRARTIVAVMLCVSLLAALPGGPTPSEARGTSPLHPQTVALAGPPVRVHVNEPPRVKPLPPGSAIRPTVVQAGRPPVGVRGAVPPMLRPADIDGVLKAAAHRRALAPAAITVKAAGNPRRSGAPGVVPAPDSRRALSLPGNPSASGTGINPWWRYQEESVPGGGRVMVNVGTGNLLLQNDDMSVPHKGIALAFRRTYNSQSQHNAAGTDGAQPGMYGNGWTNTFDAHLSRSSSGTLSVWDIDGARYDYSGSDAIGWTPPAGQHATLVSDGGCGYLWAKKSGTTYYFWTPDGAAPCAGWWWASYGAYAGRTYQIIGRNRNTYITFLYSWDNGNSAPSGKISQITAQAESGMSTILSFADVNGRRLLQQITFPDNATAVQYGYDANGNLTTVSRPPNNASGIRPTEMFGYRAIGSDSVIYYAASPRVFAACGTSGGCYNDGGAFVFGFSGTSATTSTLSTIQDMASVNPSIPDGTNSGLIQGSASPSSVTVYNTEYYTTGVTTPTFRDTEGHMTNWVADGIGRPTQTQQCTVSVSQGQQCTGIWLVANETWDANNNLTAQTDPRGYETDYAYDANGNTIAVGEPQTPTSQGTFRPTKLFDYDAFNNVTAYCDETETHAAGADWTSPPGPSGSLCSSHGVAHAQFVFSYPSYEPYGQLATMATPMGYTLHISYAASQQGGNDYGLATSVTGDAFAQLDGSSVTPSQTFWYDASGNLRCYSKGQGTWVLSTDSLGRVTMVADPDDTSANSGSICGKVSGQPGWNTQTTYTYFPDGTKQTLQTPPGRSAGVSTAYTYDIDGNAISETHHFGCLSGGTCTPGVTTKWYDGADRLVEVAQPQDPGDFYSYPWLTRYLYDLTQSGVVSISTASFRAYGNIFKTQEWLTGPGASSPSWTDLRGNAFDGLDRATAKYTFSPSANTTLSTATTQYDASAATLGLISSQVDPLGETTSFSYDTIGRQLGVIFTGDGGVTPAKTFTYDPNGRRVTANGAVYGTQTTAFDADGRVAEVDEPLNGSITSPARLIYDYYPDGSRKDLNVTSSALTRPRWFRTTIAPMVRASR